MHLNSQWLLCCHFLVLTALFACEEKPQVNTKEIVTEVKSRKIKRVMPSEITDKVTHEGERAVEKIEHNWLEALHHSLEDKGLEFAKKHCIVPFIPGYDTIASKDIVIKKWGITNFAQPSKMDTMEKQILDAYLYNVEHHLPLTPNTQKIGDDYLLFTSPIFINEAMCLQCHTKNQSKADLAVGSFAGMWSIKFRKKDIIQKIE